MLDINHEQIVLPPDQISARKPELLNKYHEQAVEARDRYRAHYEILLSRWQDKERAEKIFGSFSFIGALTLSENDFHNIPDSPLKEFLDEPSKNYKDQYRYRMAYGNEINIRGEAYYQFFDRDQSTEKRLEMSTETLKDLLERFPSIQNYVESNPNLNTQETVAYLGYLDHLKIEILRIYHAQKHLLSMEGAGKENKNDEGNISKVLSIVSENFYKILDGDSIQPLQLNSDEILSECEKIKTSIDNRSKTGENLSGIMRGLPEGDNALINKLYAIGVAKRIEISGTDNLVLAGMHFGGVELPWVILQEIGRLGLQKPEVLTVHYSRYTQKKEPAHNLWQIVDHKVDIQKRLLFLDDGVYSGDSLKSVINLAADAGFKKIEASVELLANSRQMGRMLVSGGIDPDFVDKALRDAIGVSPFFKTRTSEEFFNIKQKGLFNIVSERVRTMISKNYRSDNLSGEDIFAKVRK